MRISSIYVCKTGDPQAHTLPFALQYRVNDPLTSATACQHGEAGKKCDGIQAVLRVELCQERLFHHNTARLANLTWEIGQKHGEAREHIDPYITSDTSLYRVAPCRRTGDDRRFDPFPLRSLQLAAHAHERLSIEPLEAEHAKRVRLDRYELASRHRYRLLRLSQGMRKIGGEHSLVGLLVQEVFTPYKDIRE